MPNARFAEWILSLVTTRDRASSAVGDFMEDDARGRVWFWICVSRTALSILWRSFAAAPLSMVAFAVVGWFGYMAITLILGFVAEIVITLCWGLTYFFSHHTGLELLANLLRIRLDWPPPPPGIARGVEAIVIWIAAPIQVGRLTARRWPGREIAVWLTMLLLWPIMATYIPFAATSTRITLPMIPLIQVSMLVGILWEHRVIFAKTETSE